MDTINKYRYIYVRRVFHVNIELRYLVIVLREATVADGLEPAEGVRRLQAERLGCVRVVGSTRTPGGLTQEKNSEIS